MGEIRTDRSVELTAGPRAARLLADPPKVVVLAVCAVILALRRAQAFSKPQFYGPRTSTSTSAPTSSAGTRSWNPSRGTWTLSTGSSRTWRGVLDPRLAPAIFVWGAAAATLCVAGRTLSARCPLPHFAGLCALAVVLVPDTFEVLLNLANLQWVLASGPHPAPHLGRSLWAAGSGSTMPSPPWRWASRARSASFSCPFSRGAPGGGARVRALHSRASSPHAPSSRATSWSRSRPRCRCLPNSRRGPSSSFPR
jgi:hypothetical protein